MEIPQVKISKNVFLPIVGLGTWLLKGKLCENIVKMALEIGYRHIDTAHHYENHEAIGNAIKGRNRKSLFLTSKFSLDQVVHQNVETVCDLALKQLGTDYLDLYLLHYPDRSFDIASVMEETQVLITKQKVRAIGVSNFTQRHLQDLFNHDLRPAVNQIEFHPYLNQKDLLAFCNAHKIHVMSYRSLGKGVLTADPIFEKIGRKYQKTPTQISLRWLIEQNISVIPKASNIKHLRENIDLFNFSLDREDFAVLNHLPIQHRFCAGDWNDFNYS
jgi:2,5-diketo-D-gluconate reductase B